jgi:peptidyl-prolyl cis-trans isomerase D
MAILENIRKRTTILILIIGLALFAFVISGVFVNGDIAGSGKVGSAVAEVNGNEISVDAFRSKMEAASRNGGGRSSMQLINDVYEEEVKRSILDEQFEDLGIGVEQDQIIDFLKTSGYSQNPSFQNEDGVFDPIMFKETVLEWKNNDNQLQYQSWLQTEKAITQLAKEQTYYNLIKAGVGATLKEGEFEYKLANDKMDLKYVRIPFSSIPDSSITVTKSEITSYINAHQDEFKQEKSRDIQFVYFEEKPSAADEESAKAYVSGLMNDEYRYDPNKKAVEGQATNDTIVGFRNTTDVGAYVDRNSDIKFDTIYRAKSGLPALAADSLMALKVGETYGPYKDGEYFKTSKMIARKAGGSVKASHILVAYTGAQRANAEVTRTKEEAEARAKELLRDARKSGADFAQMAKDNSDGGSAPQGGDLGFFQRERMVPAFSNFAFENRIGAIGMVETDFGFHVIKVDDKEDIVQVAHLAKMVEASEETMNGLFTQATKFEMGTSSDGKSFPDLAKESEYSVRPVNKIKALDENLPGLGSQRQVVQWAFNEETELGAIKRFNINDGYAVVQLTATYKEGLMSVEDASAQVLPKIRKERKAAQILSEYQGKSMDEIASEANASVANATGLTVKSPTIPGAGNEPIVVGSAYAMNQDETSGLIEGQTGIFMITVTKKEEAPNLDNYSTYANNLKTASAAKVNTAVYNALKEASEIEDNRATFY